LAVVETLAGPLEVAELGITLMHEHVIICSPEVQLNYPGTSGWDEERYVGEARTKLTELKRAGVDTIVDLTVLGSGRNIPLVKRACEGTGIQVIVATGLYAYAELPKVFHYTGPGTELGGDEPMDAFFLRDIRDGIGDTGVRAGVLKCATDEWGVTLENERVLRSVARVHRATGVPISTHPHARSERGLDQQRIFIEEGVDLGRVVIGHCGDTSDVAYLERLIDAGSYLGMDRFGIDVLLPFEERVETVAALCDRGFADRLVLSHDYGAFMDFLPWDAVPELLPRWSYLHIHNDVLPALRERGVSEGQIEQMLVANPRAVFEGQGAY
jgi:phosphotriesterase-related protein